MLTKKEWDAANIDGQYGKSYKDYVKIYNSAVDYFEEYFNPRKEDISRLDSFLEDDLNMKSMKRAFGGIAYEKEQLYRKFWTPGDRRKLRKIHKLFEDSNLTLEEFKKQYKTEYLNMVRVFKYGASKKQSHSKIEFRGTSDVLPIPIALNQNDVNKKLGTLRTSWHFRKLSPQFEIGRDRGKVFDTSKENMGPPSEGYPFPLNPNLTPIVE